jgi:preprotein translocase subunit YajC
MLADAAQPQMQQDPRAQTVQMVGMLVLMGVMFYFLLIRPQQKKAKEHANLLKGLKPGDKIVTSGGIVGIVITVKDKYVTIRSADTKLEVTKPAVAEVTERGGDNRES